MKKNNVQFCFNNIGDKMQILVQVSYGEKHFEMRNLNMRRKFINAFEIINNEPQTF